MERSASRGHKVFFRPHLHCFTIYFLHKEGRPLVSYNRVKTISKIAGPMLFGMVSSNIVALVDTMFVARLGPGPLAAQSIGGFLFMLTTAFLAGIGTAVQATTGRRYGEGKHSECAYPLNTALMVGGVIVLVLMTIGFFGGPSLLSFLIPNEELLSDAQIYYNICLLIIPFSAANMAYRGYWNGIGKPWNYIVILLITNGINVVFNYILIFGKFGAPKMGIAGAATSSLIAICFSFVGYSIKAYSGAREHGFMKKRPDREQIRGFLRLTIPTSSQAALNAVGQVLLIKVFSEMGTYQVAAATVLVRITGIAGLVLGGMASASATLVAQAMGRGNMDEADQWAWDAAKIATIALVLVGLPMVFVPELVLQVFVGDDKSRAVLELAKHPLMLSGATFGVTAFGGIMMFSLQGAGDAKRVSIFAAATHYFMALPIAAFLGIYLQLDLFAVWAGQTFVNMTVAVCYTLMWKQGRWKSIRV